MELNCSVQHVDNSLILLINGNIVKIINAKKAKPAQITKLFVKASTPLIENYVTGYVLPTRDTTALTANVGGEITLGYDATVTAASAN